MVKAGDQQFAFPLAQIDRIVRISPAALEQYFESKDDYFKIDQEVIVYVIYLSLLLDSRFLV